MSQQALPFGTPSEPGHDPMADAIERALVAADLRDGDPAEGSSPLEDAAQDRDDEDASGG